jgi:hypothetical protein
MFRTEQNKTLFHKRGRKKKLKNFSVDLMKEAYKMKQNFSLEDLINLAFYGSSQDAFDFS